MSRRRAKDPTTAISITLPRTQLDKIDDRLTFTESRSAWISKACRAQLEGGTHIADASDKQLLVTLLNRGVITKGLFEELCSMLGA